MENRTIEIHAATWVAFDAHVVPHGLRVATSIALVTPLLIASSCSSLPRKCGDGISRPSSPVFFGKKQDGE